VVVLNKVDLVAESEREAVVKKKIDSLKKLFAKTKYGADVPMVVVSALSQLNIDVLIHTLIYSIDPP
jgi:translation initiation factor 2 gamma subunit (eIF-2gamma)